MTSSPTISTVRRERGSGVLQALREMAIAYEFKPGQKLSEIELAQQLGVSRTPVREALARLVTEGFLVPCTRGFMRRALDTQETLDLYEARLALERECMRLAIARASDADIDEARTYLERSRTLAADTPVQRLVELDEGFHLRIAAMSGNAELARMLEQINVRIRFIRWIAMERVGRATTQQQHRAILDALAQRDPVQAEQLLSSHIALRREQIVDAIKHGLARIYIPQDCGALAVDSRSDAASDTAVQAAAPAVPPAPKASKVAKPKAVAQSVVQPTAGGAARNPAVPASPKPRTARTSTAAKTAT